MYATYVAGRHYQSRSTAESLGRGIEMFERAAALDPAFAPAFVALAEAQVALASLERPPSPPRLAFEKARRAAALALQLDPRLATAHAAAGSVQFRFEWDWSAAERSFRRAIELAPDCATARLGLAELLSALGRHREAVTEARLAREVEPLSLAGDAVSGRVLLAADREDRAIEVLERSIELDPTFHVVRGVLADAYEKKAMWSEAVSERQNALALQGVPGDEVAALGKAYVAGGPEGAWRWRLARLRRQGERGYASPALLAQALAALNDRADAVAWARKAVDERDGQLLRVIHSPAFGGLRSDPRFAAVEAVVRLGQGVGRGAPERRQP